MFRAIFVAALFTWLTASCGGILHIRYCMNNIEEVSLFAAADRDCGDCSVPDDKGADCCHQEKQLVKLTQDQYPPVILSFAIARAADFATLYRWPSPFAFGAFDVPAHGTFYDQAVDGSPPLFVRNRVFRI